ncbi:MAG: AAA family ATPase [Arachnia propionica]|uniref:AAA family ATPase n=1 Tax=Arachnia propionica TaxID=1750 RepID=UPI002705DB44|nr:AAA family ATPase [Arachnia propionica]
MYRSVAVAGYRSLREIVVPLRQVTVVTGANGVGKSSLYKALRLLAACGTGEVIGALAREGGLSSALWAGPESLTAVRRGQPLDGANRTGPVSLRLGVGADGFSYLVDLGLPQQSHHSAFNRDPEIKREAVWGGPVMRKATLVADRRNGHISLHDAAGGEPSSVPSHASMLFEVPELRPLRDDLASWRFHDSLRTDAAAPARRPQIGTRTWSLSSDGADVAAVLQTIVEHGRTDLDALVDDAFPGSRVEIQADNGVFELTMTQPGMLRPLTAAELSDGTLRYLMWLAALHAPRRPPLMALNEPETSLHPSLIPALGRLIASVTDTQVVVVTHSAALIDAIAAAVADHAVVELVKDHGETVVSGQQLGDRPPWNWGGR